MNIKKVSISQATTLSKPEDWKMRLYLLVMILPLILLPRAITPKPQQLQVPIKLAIPLPLLLPLIPLVLHQKAAPSTLSTQQPLPLARMMTLVKMTLKSLLSLLKPQPHSAPMAL